MLHTLQGSRLAPRKPPFSVVSSIAAAVVLAGGLAVAGEPLGPVLGHVDHETARVWLRAGEPGEVRLIVRDEAGGAVFEGSQEATADRDNCLSWAVDAVEPNSAYRYTFEAAKEAAVPAGEWRFHTPPPPEQPGRVVFAIGSCASEKFPGVWQRMAAVGAEVVVLAGDTPYIDSSAVAKNRERHRAFLAQPGLAELLATRPLVGTWDDHDFGANDSDGTRVDREAIRGVFTEYRALASFGEEGEGIYTRLRRGPAELFLIDARYFSQTGPSPVDPAKKTLLGPRQWDWLKRSLAESTAPFKILVTGMVWHDKPNREKDDWQTYAHERDALFAWIGQQKISGVVLVGGDVHVSLHLRHPTKQTAGYDLFEYVVSPLHDSLIPSLIPKRNPGLLWSAAEPNVFLRMEADSTGEQPTLTSRWIRMDGTTLHEHVLR